jgi:hypothetical protein
VIAALATPLAARTMLAASSAMRLFIDILVYYGLVAGAALALARARTKRVRAGALAGLTRAISPIGRRGGVRVGGAQQQPRACQQEPLPPPYAAFITSCAVCSNGELWALPVALAKYNPVDGCPTRVPKPAHSPATRLTRRPVRDPSACEPGA